MRLSRPVSTKTPTDTSTIAKAALARAPPVTRRARQRSTAPRDSKPSAASGRAAPNSRTPASWRRPRRDHDLARRGSMPRPASGRHRGPDGAEQQPHRYLAGKTGVAGAPKRRSVQFASGAPAIANYA